MARFASATACTATAAHATGNTRKFMLAVCERELKETIAWVVLLTFAYCAWSPLMDLCAVQCSAVQWRHTGPSDLLLEGRSANVTAEASEARCDGRAVWDLGMMDGRETVILTAPLSSFRNNVYALNHSKIIPWLHSIPQP
jgi:hypothetical protein